MFDRLFSTRKIEQFTLEEAVNLQYRIVDIIQKYFGHDRLSKGGDYGQVNVLGTSGIQMGGGRPEATALAERVIAELFGAEDCALVWGAGTGAIQLGLMNLARDTNHLILNQAPVYKTTEQVLKALRLSVISVPFEDTSEIIAQLNAHPDSAVFIQHIPQKPGEQFSIHSLITEIKKFRPNTKVLVDDNYAVFRAKSMGIQMGADISMFSFFKLLGPEGVGCVLGPSDWIKDLRSFISSAGCQIQGPIALEVLRSMVHAPVSLAIQNKTVHETVERINELIAAEEHPWKDWIIRAGALQASHKNIVLQLKQPVSSALLSAIWKNGGSSYPVGEESKYDVTPMFYRLSSNYLKSQPELDPFSLRINPFRSGADTILKLLEKALRDL